MKLTVLALLLLIVIPSCTIEKRLHNRGWNVQWRKHNKVSKEKSKVIDYEEVEDDVVEQSYFEHKNLSLEPEEGTEQITIKEDLSEDVAEVPTVFFQELDDTTKKSVKTPSPYADMSTSTPRRAHTGVAERPIRLIILGIVFIIGAVLLYFAINTMTDIIAILFSFLLMLGLGIGGVIYLLVGLILLLIALSP